MQSYANQEKVVLSLLGGGNLFSTNGNTMPKWVEQAGYDYWWPIICLIQHEKMLWNVLSDLIAGDQVTRVHGS